MKYIAPRKARITDLISGPSWNICLISGCCQARVITRLAGAYYRGTPDYSKASQSDRYRIKEWPRKIYNEYFQYDAINHPDIPLEIAYCAVLQDMRNIQGKRNLLFFASDNITPSRTGDVHAGPFATRYFVRWLESEGLAEVTTSPRCGTVEGYTIKLIRRAAGIKARWGLREYNKILKLCKAPIVSISTTDREWG